MNKNNAYTSKCTSFGTLNEYCLNYFVLFYKVLFFLNPNNYIMFRLFNYGIGIHLLESANVPVEKREINPKENHISFQCSDMKLIMQKLDAMGIVYVTAVVEEGGIQVDQLFFHDPDGYMIEICNCQNLPVLPISSCPIKRQPSFFYGMKIQSFFCVFFLSLLGSDGLDNLGLAGEDTFNVNLFAEESKLMMENFMMDMLKISI